jgi:dTMP kinase
MGKLIVIEGIDGSGKQTQTEKLYQRLLQEGKKVMKVSYPWYDSPSSSLVKMYLGGEFDKNPSNISPYIASTFYAVDRYASYKKDYEQFYKDGGIVIADRYVTANIVHQAGKIKDVKEKEKFLNWLWDFEFNLFGIPVPDKVFFLNISPEISIKLMEARKNKFTQEEQKDIHEKDKNHLSDSYKNACELISKYGWDEIVCTRNEELRSIDDIHEEIYKKIEELIKKA